MSMFDVLSTNKDKKGTAFVSTIEAKKYPFYGVQWHPEKAMLFVVAVTDTLCTTAETLSRVVVAF